MVTRIVDLRNGLNQPGLGTYGLPEGGIFETRKRLLNCLEVPRRGGQDAQSDVQLGWRFGCGRFPIRQLELVVKCFPANAQQPRRS